MSIPGGGSGFLFDVFFRQAPRPNQPQSNIIRFPGLRRPERDSLHSPLSGGEAEISYIFYTVHGITSEYRQN